MKNFFKKVQNQSGSTLIVVVVAVAFVGILGTLILSLTTMNFQMKSIDKTSKANFYSAEIAMDEIKAGLVDHTAEQMRAAYEKLLINYNKELTTEARNHTFYTNFIEGMVAALGGVTNSTHVTTFSHTELEKYLTIKNVLVNNGSTDVMNYYLNPDTDPATIDYRIVLKDVEINYEDSAGYSTKIKTDIEILAPQMTSQTSPVGVPPSFGDFALIADQMIKIDSMAPGVIVDGGLYAGGSSTDIFRKSDEVTSGILVKMTGSLRVDGNHNVVTRADVVVENGAKLWMGASTNNNITVWAENIRTKACETDSTGLALLDIWGNTYVKDDLVLDAANSDVSLHGKFHGYSFGTLESPMSANKSSAVVINGRGSTLNMSELKNLVIAGKAFISAKQAVGSVDAAGTNDIVMGESMTVKHNQLVYLIPNKYMTAEHNPMTQPELDALALSGKSPVDFKGDKSITEYLLPGNPYVTLTPTSVFSSTKLTYYYLNFKSQAKANEYFADYYGIDANKSKIDEYMKIYTDSAKVGILLPNFPMDRCYLSGNMLGYTAGSSSIQKGPTEKDDVDPSYYAEEVNMNSRYKNITETLSETASFVAADDTSLFKSILRMDDTDPSMTLIEAEAADATNGFVDEPGCRIKKVQVLDDIFAYFIHNPSDPYIVDGSTPKGLIVATGQVIVRGNFTGTIISGKEIIVNQANAQIKSNISMIKDLFDANNVDVNKYFIANTSYITGTNIDTMDFSNQIVYQNWTKNGD